MKKLPIIEFHILQSFPSTCLNRDDVGSPKTAFIGGVNRARVSSQCWKRAVRMSLKDFSDHIGIRTKNVTNNIIAELENQGLTPEQCKDIKNNLISNIFSEKTLFFITKDDVKNIVTILKDHDFKYKDKNGAINSVLKEILNLLKSSAALDGVDISLFGRMLAKAPSLNVEAASYFSHAISTHKVDTEIDFFTAVPDDLSEESQGAGFLGVSEFNSATYYRYICLDLNILAENLMVEDEDLEHLKNVIELFVKALFVAVPQGKQHTYAGNIGWDFATATIRRGQAMQVSFEKPVVATGHGYLEPSIKYLRETLQNREKMYGSLYGNVAKFEWGLDHDYSIDNLISDIKESIV